MDVNNATTNKKEKKPNVILLVVLIIALVSGALISHYSSSKICHLISHHSRSEVSMHQASENALKYFNHILSGRKLSAEINQETDDPKTGLYKVSFKIKGEGLGSKSQEINAYISRNGKFVFPQAISLKSKITKIPQNDKPKVRLFVMSFCPYGNLAEDRIIPVVKLLNSKIDFKLNYIVGKNQKNNFSSLHGNQELHQDIRELCVQKYSPNKFLDFIREINQQCSYQNADKCWVNVAHKIGLNQQKISQCQNKEGNNLLNQEMSLTQKEYSVDDSTHFNGAEKASVMGSPTLIINGVIYSGKQTSQGYLDAICSAFKNKPAECQTKITENNKTVSAGRCNK